VGCWIRAALGQGRGSLVPRLAASVDPDRAWVYSYLPKSPSIIRETHVALGRGIDYHVGFGWNHFLNQLHLQAPLCSVLTLTTCASPCYYVPHTYTVKAYLILYILLLVLYPYYNIKIPG
jgi:hypothetical protein